MLSQKAISNQHDLKCYISLPHVMAARTAGIDRNEEITSPSPYRYLY